MKELVLYTKNNCANCRKAKRVLKINQVEYTEINVDDDEKALQKILDRAHSLMPVIEYEGVSYDYDHNRILEICRIAQS